MKIYEVITNPEVLSGKKGFKYIGGCGSINGYHIPKSVLYYNDEGYLRTTYAGIRLEYEYAYMFSADAVQNAEYEIVEL